MERAKKILVVDDESGIRFLLSEILLSNGFEVSLASDGQESLDKLEQGHFDLVVTDINMPRLDGVAMLKRMKKTKRKFIQNLKSWRWQIKLLKIQCYLNTK